MTPRTKRIALSIWRPTARRAAGAYVAGPTLAEALGAADPIAALGYGIVLGFWNPIGADPRAVATEDLAAAAALSERGRDWYLSIKGPALGYSSEFVEEIATAGTAGGTALHFDSHESESAEATIALAAAVRRRHADVGVTIPGRWRRSTADAEVAADLGLRVRVVKGEFPDRADPGRDPTAGFLAVIDRLAGRASHVSVATHDDQLAREAITRLSAAGTRHDVELLLGLPPARVAAVARQAGLPVRMYVPYGHASLRYGLGHLRRDPGRIRWLAHDLVLGHRRGAPPRHPGPS